MAWFHKYTDTMLSRGHIGLTQLSNWSQCVTQGMRMSSSMSWLDQFINYERTGLPSKSGTDTDDGFDLVCIYTHVKFSALSFAHYSYNSYTSPPSILPVPPTHIHTDPNAPPFALPRQPPQLLPLDPRSWHKG
jgi:hypothetical protein